MMERKYMEERWAIGEMGWRDGLEETQTEERQTPVRVRLR